MGNNAFGFLVLECTGLLVLGCGSDSGSHSCLTGEVECDGVCIAEIEPTLADIWESVFDVSCTASACHGEPNPQAELNLSTAELSGSNLIDVLSIQVTTKARVAPGDVAASYLYDKLTDQNIALGTTPMPQIGFPLCDAKILAVEAWIAEGAPE